MIRIGRSTDNDVILYSAVVSRHHVEIHRVDRGWEIKSLGTNGTYLEGKRIAQAPVQNGIIIRLARSGPNIQINTTEEKRDALKDLLESRARTAAAFTTVESPSIEFEPEPHPGGTGTGTTIIGPQEQDGDLPTDGKPASTDGPQAP